MFVCIFSCYLFSSPLLHLFFKLHLVDVVVVVVVVIVIFAVF